MCGLHLLAASPAAAQTAPSVPQNVVATPGDSQVALSWQAPSSWGDGTGGGFQVQTDLGGAFSDIPGSYLDQEDRTATSVVLDGSLSGLQNERAFKVRIRSWTIKPGASDPPGANDYLDSAWVTLDVTPTATPPPVEGGSNNADLSGLDVSTSTSAVAAFTSLTLSPSFSAATTSYTATVANTITHVKLLPTVADTGKATVTVEGTSVAAGLASAAIALGVGTNVLTVRVTAQDGTTKDYTVTITRQTAQAQSSNANLSGLTASSSTSAGGTFTSLTLSPSFSASTTSYTATVDNTITHAKLTPTVAHGSATVTVDGTTVTSGSASGAIALSEGANPLTVQVTAEDSTTRDYTVTITRQAAQAPNLPTGLTVAAGDTELTASWTAPQVDVSRYEVQIKLTSAANWPGTDTDVTGTSHTFTGLVNGSPYQVRVRTIETGEGTPSDWTSPAAGTPQAAQSSNANLSGLTASSSTSAGGTFTSLTLSPAFSAATTGYTATVVNARTHVKLTPTVADTGKATVTVQGNSVTSGSASGAIALNVGANTLTVRVTAEDGTTTKDYTVTVTRQTAATGSFVLSVDATPACGATVTDTSLRPRTVLVLTPAPREETPTEYRWLADTSTDRWQRSRSIGISGRSEPTFHSDLAELRSAYDGFTGFEFRLTGTPGVAAECTWRFEGDDGGTTPTTPTVRLSASPNPVTEGSPVTVTARLSSTLSSSVTIPVTLTDGSAEDGDYGSLSSITISSGSTSGTGTITTAQDSDTDDETFTVALGNLPSSVTAGSPSSVTVRISDDDGGGTTPTTPTVSLSVSPTSVDEGDAVTVTATLSAALSSNVRIPLTLSHGTAEDGDYGSLSSITISSGSTSGTGTIATAQDSDTDDETFTVALGNLPSSVTAGSPRSVRVTINDDDGGTSAPTTLTLSHDRAPTEGGDAVTLTATLNRAAPATGTTVTLTTSGTATRNTDYRLSSRTITIAGGETEGTATITVVDDAEDDDAETIVLDTTSVNPVLTAARLTLTIEDNDDAATALTLSAEPDPAEGGDDVTVTATLDEPAPEDGTTVTLTTGGTATLDADYTLSSSSITIAEGETAGTATITVVDDAEDDDAETVVLDAESVNPALTAATLTLTIEDNDDLGGPVVTTPTVTLSASPNPVAEGSPVTVTATLSAALGSNVIIPLTLTAGSAETGDYGTLESITVSSGATSGTGTVTTTADADTDDETFTVALGNLPTSVKAGNPNSVEITITDATPRSMSLSAVPETVVEGGAVTIIATASETVRANTEVKLVRDGPTSTASDEDFSFDAPQMGVITILDGQTSGTLTLTATDDELVEDDESLTLNGLVGDTAVGSVTLTIEDNDEVAITYTLSGPEDSNIVEGRSYELTVTASSAVEADTIVEIMRDAAASTAGEDDFRVGQILITAGKTTGSNRLMVTADDLPDGGTGTSEPETLVLFGTIDGMEIGDLTFTIWDAAVPALPVGGALLLGLLLARRGAGARTGCRGGRTRHTVRPARVR